MNRHHPSARRENSGRAPAWAFAAFLLLVFALPTLGRDEPARGRQAGEKAQAPAAGGRIAAAPGEATRW